MSLWLYCSHDLQTCCQWSARGWGWACVVQCWLMTFSKAVNPLQPLQHLICLSVCLCVWFRGEMGKIFPWLRPKTLTTDDLLPLSTSKKSLIRIKICTAVSPNQSVAPGCLTLQVLSSEVRIFKNIYKVTWCQLCILCSFLFFLLFFSDFIFNVPAFQRLFSVTVNRF